MGSSLWSVATPGDPDTANYRAVSTGTTKHAEAIEIVYDPTRITREQLLEVFFDAHDPTQLNRQGPDVGTQYRSAIFYAGPEEKAAAQQIIDRLNADKKFRKPIVTTLEPLEKFFPQRSTTKTTRLASRWIRMSGSRPLPRSSRSARSTPTG